MLSQCAASAATVQYNFNIIWVTANPDGLHPRSVIGINGQWPPPVLSVTRGDRIIANVCNGLGNQTTSLHWYGIFQNGTTHMGGAPAATQCGIAPGGSFTYYFTVAGTYWYHSHTRGQYPDGLRQALIVMDPLNPYLGQYDEGKVVSLSDWYHDQMPGLLKKFISVTNPTGAEPNVTVSVYPGKTYLIRLVNVGAFASQRFWIEAHTMRIVEVDGNESTRNYPMMASMDTGLFDTVTTSLNYNVTGWLGYNDEAEKAPTASVRTFDTADDMDLFPTDGLALYPEPNHVITLDLSMDSLGDGANYAFFNKITYISPKVPSLYTTLSSGPAATDPTIYGRNTNAFILEKGEIVDIVLNNDDTGKHPFHLHGHGFQVITRSADNAGHFNASDKHEFPPVPMRRDTLLANPLGHFVIRSVADNPGIWLFHSTMVEAPLDLQQSLAIPQDHYQACNEAGTPKGENAAGNTENIQDHSGVNTSPEPLPEGFTAHGIIALVFSCLAAILGLATIVWYGLAPISGQEAGQIEHR
ncbi:Cupredoxin [Aspergillus insuetus]